MTERGKPSNAHEYDKNNECKWCGMYKVNVEALSHVCTPVRELMFAAKDVPQVETLPKEPEKVEKEEKHGKLREVWDDIVPRRERNKRT